MHVQYSDALVNVGNLDIFAATWQKIYATDGNGQGAINDNTYYTYSSGCKTVAHAGESDLTVRMEMNGAWGANDETGINMYQMRDAIVQTSWAAFNALATAKRYDVYNNCDGLTWFDSVLYTANAACGGLAPVKSCPACDSEMAQCMDHSYGLWLPSTLRVSAYLNDELLPDAITFTLSSTTDSSAEGCGLLGAISKALASYIPVVGSLFSAGIQFECGGATF